MAAIVLTSGCQSASSDGEVMRRSSIPDVRGPWCNREALLLHRYIHPGRINGAHGDLHASMAESVTQIVLVPMHPSYGGSSINPFRLTRA